MLDENDKLIAAFAASAFRAFARGEGFSYGMMHKDDYSKYAEQLKEALQGKGKIPEKVTKRITEEMKSVDSKSVQNYIRHDHADVVLSELDDYSYQHKLAAKNCVVAPCEVNHVSQEKGYQKLTVTDMVDGMRALQAYHFGPEKISPGMVILRHWDGVVGIYEKDNPAVQKLIEDRKAFLKQLDEKMAELKNRAQ